MLLVWGAGGFGRAVTSWAQDAQEDLAAVAGFIDDDPSQVGASLSGLPVMGDRKWLSSNRTEVTAIIIGVGTAAERTLLADFLEETGIEAVSVIHRSAVIGARTSIGVGAAISPGCVIDPDVRIQDLALINKLVSVGHDTTVGHAAVVSPGVTIGGGVVVGDGCTIGMGASILPDINVGAGATVGSGAVVTRSVPPGTTVFGVPARPNSNAT